ncbi:MAG TPA: response regulator [Candidatus Saccharimonadales bacterium]|nr:response regulator [Candidatus Saccharimonadales bacterium]
MNTPPKQYQLLFVDDDSDFLAMIRDFFASLGEKIWQIHCANSADQALEFLKTRKVDLVVSDVNMPMLDGIQFLHILNRSHPNLKKAVITANATEEKRSACLAEGAELFIEKPRSPEGLKSIFIMLEELITWTPQEGFQGVLRRVGLPDVIQMECLGRNSSILEIHNQQLRGQVYIEDGRIIHAEAGGMVGENAFYKLLTLVSGEFELQPFELPSKRTIEGQWEFLLMEAARVRDETASQTGANGPTQPDSASALITSPAASDLAALVLETLICSGNGEPLYAWQCTDAPARVTLLQNLAQIAAFFGQLVPLGNFDRLVIELPDSRAVAQVKADRMVFVRVSAVGEKYTAQT